MEMLIMELESLQGKLLWSGEASIQKILKAFSKGNRDEFELLEELKWSFKQIKRVTNKLKVDITELTELTTAMELLEV